jgi:hypothetical protein
MFDPTMDKLRLLDSIRMEHDFLMRSLAGLTPDVMERPETLGAWSIKGLLAHLTFWQQHYLDVMARAARGEAPAEPPYGLPDVVVDAINARAFEAARSRPLAVVWGEFHASVARCGRMHGPAGGATLHAGGLPLAGRSDEPRPAGRQYLRSRPRARRTASPLEKRVDSSQ